MRISLPRPFLLLLGGLFLVNLLQAFTTELLYDEAYYWYYAQNPAWGYFDHPPMVAWMIGAGTVLFENELGVRLVSCLLGIGIIYLLWELTEHPDKKTYWREFFVWVFSMTLLQAYGFLSLPDTPLLFFTALFLLGYKRFLQKPGIGISLLLGLCMAALMYSKYHAALVILLVLISNLSLLKSRYAWLALGVSLFCYLPHLYWLFQNDFVSIKFHLFERPNQPYSFTKFTLGFLLNLVALFGLTFPWVYRTLLKTRHKNLFEKALLYLTVGFLIFFFVSSFQRRVQTQWLIVVCVPLGVLVAQRLMSQSGLRKWIWRMGLINILILGWLRFGLVHEPIFPGTFESHGNKAWVQNLDSAAGGASVVFENSYRKASMYQFYSRKPSFSLNNTYYRKNQYSIDGSEELLRGKEVFYILKGARKTKHYYTDAKGNRQYGYFIENFQPYRRLEARISQESQLKPGDRYQMWLYNPYDRNIPLSELTFGVAYLDPFKRANEVRNISVDSFPLAHLPGRDSVKFEFVLPAWKAQKEIPFYIRAVISENGLPWGINGSAQPIEP
ncbi:MAG: glycosyltransferase family 39 protein [Robiginitalea sp.]